MNPYIFWKNNADIFKQIKYKKGELTHERDGGKVDL